MPPRAGSFGAQLKALREAAGFTQEELATISGLSVHAVSALERGERRRPHVETVRSLSAALDLLGPERDAFLASARAASATAVDELSRASLQLPLTVLIGREVDVETLRQWLADPTSRLITLVGPGGVGKTRLALELARVIAEEGSPRVVFVALAALRDPAFVAPAIAEALGLSDLTNRDLLGRARAACADRPTLMVLDNFEHLLAAAPLVADFLTSVLPLRLLVTSRAPLRVRGEREYAVGPLALADSKATSPADLARAPAVRLFIARVHDVRPDFRLTPANGQTVVAICRRLDALPLALELAAPWVKVLTLEDLLNRLENDIMLGAVGARDLPERQQTMNATVAWSYQLLDPEEQRAFRRLGVLPGLFPIDAAEAVLAGHEASPGGSEGFRLVGGLINKSLLLRSEASGATRPLYQMLETVRAYAARELAASADLDDAMEGLARYCAGEAALAFKGLVGPAQAEWLNRVHEDLESHRGALSWLIARGRGAEASGIAWGLLFFWVIRGQAAEGLRWYEATLNLPSLPSAARARALTGAALLCFSQGELESARTAATRALAVLHAAPDVEAVVRAEAEEVSARVEIGLGGDLAAAHRWFARAMESFKALALPWGVGDALIGMSAIPLETGDVQQAERLLDEATSVLRQAGPWFLARALLVRAILAIRRGAPDEALQLVRLSLTHSCDLHDTYAFVHATVPLAAAAALKGDYTWAARILGARDVVTERTGARIVIKPAHDLAQQVERDVREHLGPDRWGRAYAVGRSTSIDSLLGDIDGTLGRERDTSLE